jgi:aldose 1-epimerase
MKIKTFHLKIPGQIEMTFLNYGGIIQSLKVPDHTHKMDDVVLGFDHVEDYKKVHPYFGALIGRYANRIKAGKFTLDDVEYELNINNPPNTLHGGHIGFDRVYWDVEMNPDGKSCTLKHESPAGHEGYPGNLSVEVTYRELIIDYKAQSDQATPINFTNHSYFNLGGVTKNTILDHELWINADHFTSVDGDLIPTGEIFTVKGSKDFRVHKLIGQDINQLPGGYDHNYVLNEVPLRDPKARLRHPPSGRTLEIFTTEPGMQFYSGNFLDGSLKGKGGVSYQKHHGLCLETQHFPDSPNHPFFPSAILRPSEIFNSKTIYQFTS